MRKTSKLLLALATVLAFTACTSEVEDVFDESPSQRIEKALTTDKQVLVAAENGWLMEYYGNTDFGGYSVFCKFNADNTVAVSSEVYGADKTVTSHYKLEQSQGVILSFDEYNAVIHDFADPNPYATLIRKGSIGKGFEGDFEFRVIKCTADSVIMTGKKHGSRIVMTPFSGDWKAYVNSIKQSESDMAFGSYIMVVGQDTATLRTSGRTLNISYKDSTDLLKSIRIPFIQRPGTFKFYKPLELFGTTVNSVSYDNTEENIFKTDNDRMAMKGVISPINQQFIEGTWATSLKNMGDYAAPYWEFIRDEIMPALEEELVCFYIGAPISPDWSDYYGDYWGIHFQSSDYAGIIGMKYRLSYDEAKDQHLVTLWLDSKGCKGNGDWYLNNAYFHYLVIPFGCNTKGNPVERTFIVTADNTKKPTQITLTDRKNPENIIQLFSEDIEDPLNN